MLVFTAAAALLTAVLFGLCAGLALFLSGSGRGVNGWRVPRGATGAASARMRRGLAVAQCAFAVLLLVPAALLGRTLFALLARTPGFDVEQTLTFST